MDVTIHRSMNNKLTQVSLGRLTLWFSYETIVAFMHMGVKKVTENVWGTTTGRHLNAIQPNKKLRMDHNKFVQEIDLLLNKLVLSYDC